MIRPAKNSGVRWRGLLLQLFGITVLPLTVLTLVIAFGSFTIHQRAMRALVGQRDERAARSIAGALGEQLDDRMAAVRSLAQHAADGASPASILAASDFVLHDFDGGVAFYSPDGARLAVTPGNNANPSELFPTSTLSLPWRAVQGTTPNPWLTDLLRRAGPEPVLSPALAIPPTGELYVLAAASAGNGPIAVGAFSATALARRSLADVFTPNEPASAFVADATSQIIYQAGSLALSENISKHPGLSDALQGQSGATYVPTTSGEHVVAFSPIAPTGWALVIEEQWEAVTSPMLRNTEITPLVLVPALLLALVALWFGARQVVRPLQMLEAKATDLAWGQFEAIEQPVGGIAEIRRLQAELIHMAHKVRAAQESLRDYIGAITRGQEEERRRLARELHDDTLQSLIALNQRIQLAQLALADSPAAGSLAEIQMLMEQTMSDLRRFTRALRPIYLEDLGLVAALEMLTREVGQADNLRVEFHRTGSERRLSSEVELALYRMAQEALSNVTRHAQAVQASLGIAFKPDAVIMTISDNGRGFRVPASPAELAPSGHFGLLGLHERAELIGARLAIQSAPGRGTQVIVNLPAGSKAQPGKATTQPSQVTMPNRSK